ncbi:hypothetical protein HG530_007994 [Fusarium avenaceum]|nr:hypothetical protein HG530_007994 [Fusarium avenaceum]
MGVATQVGCTTLCANTGGLIEVSNLLGEAFMESEYSRLGGTIVHIRRLCGKGSLASNVDNVAVVLLDHAWEELLSKEYGSDNVDIKDSPNTSLRHVQKRVRICKASVIDENGWVPMLGSDSISNR